MAKENKTKYVILGLLVDQPMTGYDIKEFIKRSTAYFWQESDASIYPTLKLLAQEKMVNCETVFIGKKRKDIYSITEKGITEFNSWFHRTPAPDTRKHEFLLKLFFTHTKNKKDMRKHCKQRLDELQILLKEYQEIERSLQKHYPQKKYWIKTVQNGIAHIELDLSWIQKETEGF